MLQDRFLDILLNANVQGVRITLKESNQRLDRREETGSHRF